MDTVIGCWGRRESSSFSFNYLRTPGPTSSSLGPSSSALDLFSRFYSDDVWELLKVETNRYADSTLIASPVSLHTRPWSSDSVEEVKAFIGILILIGILKLPHLEMYWSTQDPLIGTPGIANVMSGLDFNSFFVFFT